MAKTRRRLKRAWQEHRVTFAKFVVIAGLTAGIGHGILKVEITQLGWNSGLAFLLQSLTVVSVNFYLNWRITWKAKPARGQSAWRWTVVQVFLYAPGYFLYEEITRLHIGLPLAGGNDFLVAKALSGAFLVIPGYLLAASWAFATRPKQGPIKA